MTPAGMTPEPGWRLVNHGEPLQVGDQYLDEAFCDAWEDIYPSYFGRNNDMDLIGAPVRRRMDTDPDPCEPLRAELREAYGMLSDVRHGIRPPYMEVDMWLQRNAGFGPGKGEE